MPFVRASQSSDTALMQLLLDYGADPFLATDNGDTALTASSGIGWVEGVTYERSAKENFEAMRMLLDLGLNPNGANREGRTPLMGAALKGRSDVVQLPSTAGPRSISATAGAVTPTTASRCWPATRGCRSITPTASSASACSRRSRDPRPPRRCAG